MDRIHRRPNLPLSLPLSNVYKELVKDLRNVNMWSFEYIASTYIKLLELFEERKAVVEKKKVVEEISKCYERTHVGELLSRTKEYLDEIANALCHLGFEVRSIDVELKSRGVVGTSSGFSRLLFDWGISFDPYLNIVYIPASTIKGAVKAAYRYLCIKSLRDKKLCENKVDNVFGSAEEGAGLLTFTDAYPVELGSNLKYILVPDVITPHYKEEVKYEKDAEPTPLIHLSISKGVVFRFLMYYTSRGKRSLSNDDLAKDLSTISSLNDLKLVDKSILLAFGLGVGAKTLTGYSQFTIRSYKKLCVKV